MTGAPTQHASLLRWYPPEWRDRYGDEFLTLLFDTYATGPIPARVRISTARAGVAERLRGVGLVGESADPEVRLRGASLLVLCAWAFFVVAGSVFAKFAEHWDRVTPARDRALPSASYDAVQVAAFIAVLVVALAAACALPAFLRSIRRQGWALFSRPLWALAVTSSLALAATVAIVLWGHHVGPARRDGGWFPYKVGGLTWALTVLVAIAVGTGAIVAIAARLRLSRSVARILAGLALTMAVALVAVFLGVLAWWIALATSAPWFLGSGPVGSASTSAPPVMIVCGGVMVLGLALAMGGARRIVSNLGVRSDVGVGVRGTASDRDQGGTRGDENRTFGPG